ncbi:MAG: amidohydrolase [Planctomycetes bacterium]|nr:amidohydrolase [Planctomycetota bacterium]MBM4086479.1 amidohydrolase [Planctomycetota bacterium]
MKKIDVHTHLGEWYLPNNCGSVQAMLDLMADADIELAVCSSAKAVVYDMREGNADMQKVVDAHPPIKGYIYFNCLRPEESIDEIERYAPGKSARGGFIGVKTRADYHGQLINSSANRRILKVAEKHKLPLLLHTFGAAMMNAACDVAKDMDIKIIAGHMGGPTWPECVRIPEKIPNIYLEPCATCNERDRIRAAVDAVGPDRVVFGSDLTLIHPAWTIGMIESADLSDDMRRKIYSENARRVFGLA